MPGPALRLRHLKEMWHKEKSPSGGMAMPYAPFDRER